MDLVVTERQLRIIYSSNLREYYYPENTFDSVSMEQFFEKSSCTS